MSRSFGPEVERPGGTDGLGVDTDDLAELADDHEFAGFVDEVDAGDLADPRGCLHVDDVGASAGLETVLVVAGALAEAVLGDGEDEARGCRGTTFEDG
jgi:hypothetical protein